MELVGNKWVAIILGFLLSCSGSVDPGPDKTDDDTFVYDPAYHQFVLDKLEASPDGYVMVAAHRGDHLNHPENSLAGIQSCVEMGVDIVEVDVQMTKDDVLVLMHDQTLDRTTFASGNVSDYTWEELRTIQLTHDDGTISNETIPSLEEAFRLAKGKICLFVDKSYDHLERVFEVAELTGTTDQLMVEGIASWEKFVADYPAIHGQVNFVPRIGTGQSSSYIRSHLENETSRILFPSCNLLLEENENTTQTIANDKWHILSTLKNSNCSEAFDTTWDWAIDQGIDIIVTDQPLELLNHLRLQEKHQ